jgi:hypothetical protein
MLDTEGRGDGRYENNDTRSSSHRGRQKGFELQVVNRVMHVAPSKWRVRNRQCMRALVKGWGAVCRR